MEVTHKRTRPLPSKDIALRYDFNGRTHLTSIIGFAEILADPAVVLPREKQLEYAEIVLACAEALHREQSSLAVIWDQLPDD